MESAGIITSALVLIAIAILSLSIMVGVKIRKIIPADLLRRWVVLISFLVFFILGNVVFLYIIASRSLLQIKVVSGAILLSGACFVLFVLMLLKTTVHHIIESRHHLDESETRYSAAIENSPIGIVVCNAEGQAISTNQAMADIAGGTKEQILKQNYHKIGSWKESGLFEKAVSAVTNNRTEHLDTELTTSFGKQIYISSHFTPLNSGELLVMMQDITDLLLTQKELNRALGDKDLLMREVQHRTKNNLSVIQSLLALQALDISDEKLREYFEDAKNRVNSMTLIYEMLNGVDDVKRLGSSVYIRELTELIFRNYKVGTQAISLQYDIEDIELDVDTLIPLGIIINELVTNALKYAFPDAMAGTLGIALKATGDEQYELLIKDTGVGLPEGFNLKAAKSLGLQIVDSLVHQINGTLKISQAEGTEFRITFRDAFDH